MEHLDELRSRLIVSLGAFFLGASTLLFVYNLGKSLRDGRRAGPNPWDAPTLEWSIPSPPPVYNFRDIPIVRHRDPLWAEKYGVDDHSDEEVEFAVAGKTVTTGGLPDDKDKEPLREEQAAEQDEDGHGIHMPNPSYYPLIAGIGMFFMWLGMLFELPNVFSLGPVDFNIMTVLGFIAFIGGIYGWSFEPASDPVPEHVEH